jgi:hypothetical protein
MPQPPTLTQAQLLRHIRRRLGALLFDESPGAAAGVAIYSLSDPRDIRAIRYVGQSAAPRRRLLQHLSAARLWLPDEKPWWVRAPQLRPLYAWIRQLYADESRLPVMVISAWVEPAHARAAERLRIHECLQRQLPLLNAGTELLRRQRLLI